MASQDYGLVTKLRTLFGQGGVQTIRIDDGTPVLAGYPYMENVIEILRTDLATQRLIMPPQDAFSTGPFLHFIYSNGLSAISLEPAVGNLVTKINGVNAPHVFAATGVRQAFIVYSTLDSWNAFEVTGHTGTGIASVAKLGAVEGPVLISDVLEYELPIPGQVISSSNGIDALDIIVSALHQAGTVAPSLKIGWKQGVGAPFVLGSTLSIGGVINKDVSLKASLRYNTVEATLKFYAQVLEENQDLSSIVADDWGVVLDLDLPWTLVIRTDAATTTGTIYEGRYEAKRLQ